MNPNSGKNEHPQCWARCKGGCSPKISREHVISGSLLDSDAILVQGFSWCKEDYKSVGINSLTVKALCEAHNQALSPVDDAGVFAMKEIRRLALLPSSSPGSTAGPPPSTSRIDGLMLERWLLKTAINTSVGNEFRIGPMGERPGLPAPYLVAVAYGDIPFSHAMGLYAIVQEGSFLPTSTEIVFVPVTRDDVIGGWYVGLFGIDFFLSVFPLGRHTPPPANLRSIGVSCLPAHVLDGTLHYRVSDMSLYRGAARFRGIQVNWNR